MKTTDLSTQVLCGVAAAVCSATLLFGPAAAKADAVVAGGAAVSTQATAAC